MSNKNVTPKKPQAGQSGSSIHSSVSIKPPSNGYTPKYIPPAEPAVIPPPNVENNITLPQTIEVTTLTDLEHRILANASIVYPGVKLKVATWLSPSGMLYHALLMTPRRAEHESAGYKVTLKGPAIPSEKRAEASGRRKALEALLEEVERKVGKEIAGMSA